MVTVGSKQLLLKSNCSEEVLTVKKQIFRKCSCSGKVATYARRGFIIWKKIDYVYVILSCCLNICFLSQYFFLGNRFTKSAFSSTNLFQGLPEGLQLNGLYFGSSLGFCVIGSPQVPGSSVCLTEFQNVFFKV